MGTLLAEFCSLDLFYSNGLKACSKYTAVAYLLKVLKAKAMVIWVKKDTGKEPGLVDF